MPLNKSLPPDSLAENRLSKNRMAVAFLVAGLFFWAPSVQNPAFAQCNPNTPECDPSLNPQPCKVTQSITLSPGIYSNKGFEICAGGIVVNGGGATIQTGSISIQGLSGVTIKNFFLNHGIINIQSCSYITVENCSFNMGPGGFGSFVTVGNSNNIAILNNQSLLTAPAPEVVTLGASTFCRVEGNTFNAYYGILLDRSRKNIVKDNILVHPDPASGGNGITIGNTPPPVNQDGNLILRNLISGYSGGIQVTGRGSGGLGSHHTVVDSNEINGAGSVSGAIGITLLSDSCFISRNFIHGYQNFGFGIQIFSGPGGAPLGNTVVLNTLQNNATGIYENTSSFDGNRIYFNNLIGNTDQGTAVDFLNYWDADSICGGNYWSNFDDTTEGCFDTNSDGICDTLKTENGGPPVDRYPFVSQSGWSNGPNPLDSCVTFPVLDTCSFGWRTDTDGDALPDCWESEGYDHNGDSIVDVDLPAMGADPLHKDVFVETDWMATGPGETQSHQPSVAALNIVINSFTAAPVANPDGSTGISLHVDYGQGGEFSKGNSVPHDNDLNLVWTEFDAIKNAHFEAARHPIFHYCVFAHRYDGGTSSGVSRNPEPPAGWNASDFIVSLGGWTSNPGTVDEQAGTFMHEFGHNLGLRHGGGDHTNYKPNFLSIMSYAFQTRGLRFNGDDGLFDYSRFVLPVLNENSLNENVGLNGGAPIANYGTRYYCPGTGNPRTENNANNPIDWDCDNSIETSVSGSVNQDTALDNLDSFNDWPNLVFNGGLVGGGLSPDSLPMQTPLDTMEITYEEDLLVCTPRGDLTGDGQYTPADVVSILNFVFVGTTPPAGAITGDLDCNGQYSPADVVQELNFVFLGSPRPCCL